MNRMSGVESPSRLATAIPAPSAFDPSDGPSLIPDHRLSDTVGVNVVADSVADLIGPGWGVVGDGDDVVDSITCSDQRIQGQLLLPPSRHLDPWKRRIILDPRVFPALVMVTCDDFFAWGIPLS